MTKHLTGVPPVSSTYCMTHDNHTRCRSSFRKSERARDPELGIWTRECVLASALYTMTAGVALLVQGLRSSKRAISPQGTTPLSRNERKFGIMPGSSTHASDPHHDNSSVEARQAGVLGRLRSSWRRSAAICWRT